MGLKTGEGAGLEGNSALVVDMHTAGDPGLPVAGP